jgi:WD40 repeat protein
MATVFLEVWSLVELPNGKLISGPRDGTLRSWREGKPIGAPIPSDQGTVSRLVELDNGELISGGGDGTIRRWRNGQPLGPPIPTGNSEVLSLLVLRQGELISGGTDGNLSRWRQGKPHGKPIATGQGMVWSLLEWGNGEVLSGGNDGTLRVWSNGAPLGEAFQVGSGKILNLARLTVIDDQRQSRPQLVSSSDDGTFRIYQRPETVVREACLQLRHHPALLTPALPAEKAASRTCRQLPVLPPTRS